MATLDKRIWPLLELLSRSGLDWLAEDIVATVLAHGDPPEAPNELAAGRRSERRVRDTDAPSDWPSSLEGDAQLDWAPRYVVWRLHQAVKQASESLEMIDQIAEGGSEGKLKGASELAGRAPRAGLCLRLGETKFTIDRQSVELAQAPLQRLEKALEVWRSSSLDRGGGNAD